MNDVRFSLCGAKGCRYRWNWCSRTTCFKCGSKLGVSAVEPPAPRGVWSKPRGGEPGTWTEAGSRRSRKWNAPIHEVALDTSKGPTDAVRLLESLRTMLPSLADCAELTALADKVDVERKAAQIAKPLSVKAKHLEQRVAHKRRTQASAQERVDKAMRTVEEAQVAVDAARVELNARNEELQALEKELAELPMEPIPEQSRTAGLPQLPEELAGDSEAQEAIAKAQAAADEAQRVIAAKLQRAAPAVSAKGVSDDGSPMDLDEETTAEVDALLDTLGSESVAADADSSVGVAKRVERIELKRQLTSAVAKGLVKKKIKKDQQCG